MTITIPKPSIPGLVKVRVPGWFFVAALVAQYVIVNATHSPSPTCTLKFENPHYSTSLAKGGVDAIKVNISSECTKPQAYTQISARISRVQNGVADQIYLSAEARAQSSIKNPYVASFQEFWVKCTRGAKHSYVGSATGYVLLKNGTRVPVSDNSGKPFTVICQPKAK